MRVGQAHFSLRPGGWSEWAPIVFEKDGKVFRRGMCRFYLASARPDVELYATPVQVDPLEPAFDISHPPALAAELARRIGVFSTLGVPEDTNALRDGVLSADAFLAQCEGVAAERERMLEHFLNGFDRGLLAFVFDTTDRIQHVFWSALDPEHPAHNDEFARKYGGVIDDWYCRMDAIVGRIVSAAGDSAAVLVVSDHGFGSFRRAVHLNSWLVRNGFMALRDESQRGRPFFRAVDWARTVAYAVGFTSVYLNLAGREGRGCVSRRDADMVIERLRSALRSLSDPENGNLVIKETYRGDRIYRGARAPEAPDLVIGYAPGYRASSQTAMGACPASIIEPNTESWPGDHLVDPTETPGVMFCNVGLAARAPSVMDVAPTVLSLLGLEADARMEGCALEVEARG